MTENVRTTKKAREKFAKAHGGASSLPHIIQIAFGDGGHDVLGQPIPPTGEELNVPGEFIRKNIESTEYPTSTTLRIVGLLDYTEGNERKISSIGLYDSEGDLIAIKTFPPIPKTSDSAIETTWEEKF